ncbi:hypothetical protein FRB94_005997 [Tulasnella sp. JGI-2019a]|nr:hypothetical protein FRB94_005997 [Tulasnella sp. JGI-2019a]
MFSVVHLFNPARYHYRPLQMVRGSHRIGTRGKPATTGRGANSRSTTNLSRPASATQSQPFPAKEAPETLGLSTGAPNPSTRRSGLRRTGATVSTGDHFGDLQDSGGPEQLPNLARYGLDNNETVTINLEPALDEITGGNEEPPGCTTQCTNPQRHINNTWPHATSGVDEEHLEPHNQASTGQLPSITYNNASKHSLPGKFGSVGYDDEGDEDLDLEIEAHQEAQQLKKQKHNNAHVTLKSYQEDATLYEVVVLARELIKVYMAT